MTHSLPGREQARAPRSLDPAHATAPTDRRHLLTVLHAAERSGPPLLALRFLRWLQQRRPTWTLTTLSLGGSTELLADFGELGPTHVAMPVRPDGPGAVRRLAAAATNRGIWASIRRHGSVDLAHVHCVGSMRVLDAVPHRTPVLCHVHELSVGQDLHLGPRALAHVAGADRYVTVADVVTRELLGRFPIDPSRVERDWGFVPPDVESLSAERRSLGLDERAFVVVSSGVRHWRKAPELFVRIARAAALLRPDVPWQFVWVGGSDVGGLLELVHDAGLDDVVQFLDHRPDSLAWVAAADVFLLPAREDAFPLVCVEAAALARPITTFDNGGAVELVEQAGCGRVVPFPDVNQAASTLIELADDPELRRHMGQRGRTFALEHLTIDTAGPALLDVVERTMRRR